MKILHISDTHGFHNQLPLDRFNDIDVVIHSGDCSNWKDTARNSNEVFDFLEWYMTIPVKHKIYVAGNHDTSIEKRIHKKENFTDRNIIYLEHEEITIDGVNFFGSPYTPTFGEWSFMKKREKINREWELIPHYTNVLIIHGPPKGIRDLSFDRNNNLEMCGCSALFKRCMALKDNLKLVAFGHIHDMDGVYNQGVSTFYHVQTIFSNAACVHDGRFDLGLTSYGNIIEI